MRPDRRQARRAARICRAGVRASSVEILAGCGIDQRWVGQNGHAVRKRACVGRRAVMRLELLAMIERRIARDRGVASLLSGLAEVAHAGAPRTTSTTTGLTRFEVTLRGWC